MHAVTTVLIIVASSWNDSVVSSFTATVATRSKISMKISSTDGVDRKSMLTTSAAAMAGAMTQLLFAPQQRCFADPFGGDTSLNMANDVGTASPVAYKSLQLPMPEFGVTVPVACWFPTESTSAKEAVYNHRISIRRIGQLLAGWDFIPEFASKNIQMKPTLTNNGPLVLDGADQKIPDKKVPVIMLAHGYLGSRFDMAHLAEKLASLGYLCISCEYPESLAASYDRMDGLDRSKINVELLQSITSVWNIKATRYGIIGHSLGCGTVTTTGDSSWTRVSIAGFPRNRDGTPLNNNGLFIASMGDSLISSRISGPQEISDCGYALVSEEDAALGSSKLAKRSALVFDRSDHSPNHISFLSTGVNDAMIDFLSPLLPVAQTFNIPVLDFDKYKESRDSKATADVVHPLIIQYLQQEMI